MRIVIDGRYVQDGFPGIGRYTYNLIRALAVAGGDDELLVLHDPTAPNRRYDMRALDALAGVRLVSAPVARYFPAEQRALPGIVRRLAPDLFHGPYYLRPYPLPCPVVLTVHDLIPLHHPRDEDGPLARLFFRLTTRLACRTARAILCPSDASRHDLIALARAPAARVHVAPLAADAHFAPPAAAAIAALRQRYDLAGPYVLCFGSNEPHKNLRALVAAWSRVVVERGAAAPDGAGRLVIAGRENPRFPSARAHAEAHGVAASVRVLGDVADPDLPALYAGAELVVCPSLSEGFGLTVLEAMACGSAVIAARAGGLPEVAGDAALMIDPTDVGALAAAMVRGLAEPALRAELGVRGRARSACFSWSATAAATRGAYRAAADAAR